MIKSVSWLSVWQKIGSSTDVRNNLENSQILWSGNENLYFRCVLVGLIFIGITHTGTDAILEITGVLPKGNLHVGTGLILS